MIQRIIYFIRRFLWPHKWIFFAAILTGLLVSATSGLGVPLMVKYIFPIVFYSPDSSAELPLLLRHAPALRELQESSPQLVLMLACASMPLIFLLRGIFMWLNGIIASFLGIKISETLRMTVFRRVLELPIAFSERRQKGDIISRILADTGSVQSVLTHISNDLFKQPITCLVAIATFIWMLLSGGQSFLFIINLFLIALALWPIISFGRRISKKARIVFSDLGKLNSTVQQNLETIREVRAYSLESRQIHDFSHVVDHYCYNVIKLVKYQRAIIPLMEIVTSLALAFLLVRGRESGMILSDFLALAAVVFFLFDSMKKTGTAFNRLNEAQGALSRVEEILTEPDSMPDPPHPTSLPARLRGDISFHHVSFAYEPGKPVLSDIHLHIPAGQIVGLVGSSGAGKTTFASLIPRFYDVSSGSLMIDGIDIRQMRRHDLRSQLALVGQQALLFSGSIRENIALGRPSASEADILAAADAAAVTPFLSAQPQGIDTRLGESGAGLSGGQRQRVAIARAFVKDAPILILDEATASLDAESERDIQRELEALSAGRTTLIVAHRFSTLRHAHRILVFDHGRIIADGPHADLYSSCPLYKELYDRQGV